MNLYDRIFKKFHQRLIAEGVLRALLPAAIVGCSVGTVVAAALYCASVHSVWIAIVCGLVTMLAVAVFAYFFRYRPNEQSVAQRVDMQGLKERIITMIELKDDDSFIARTQREDALNELKRVQNVKIPFSFSARLLTAALVLSAVGILSVTLVGVSFGGYLPSIDEIVSPVAREINLNYYNGEGGFLIGDTKQVIGDGEKATEVVAVAELGYMFSQWSDGNVAPNRTDSDAQSSVDVTAVFVPIDADANSGFVDDADALDPDFDESNMEGEAPENMPGAAGKYEDYNQIIDGETYYRDVLNEFYRKMQDILNQGGAVPEYIKVMIEEYYKVIE